MHVLRASNVNHVWPRAIDLIRGVGVKQETRAGAALVVPTPVATVYESPVERVLFDPVRDANPIFHHMEALWMLAGRDDATWLDQFVSDFSRRFAEESGRMHGAYGKRWRGWFNDPLATVGENGLRYDQLDAVVHLLRKNPQDRQAVIQMWDPSADLGVPGLKDRPCNQQILLRCDRYEEGEPEPGGGEPLIRRFLDMTVTNRSNDAVYGCYGANAYHMSVLQEYLAARIGVEVGTYTQFSNNLHMYEWSSQLADYTSASAGAALRYPGTRPLVDHPESFDEELRVFLEDPLSDRTDFRNSHFRSVARLMFAANERRREREWEEALKIAGQISAPDLRLATVEWLKRRAEGASAGRETRE